MKRATAATLAALALAACSDTGSSPIAPERIATPQAPVYDKTGSGVDGDYIVVFKDDVGDPVSMADEKAL